MTAALATGVSVVVPVHNAAPQLSELVERITLVLAQTTEAFEIILVNDGSTDRSWAEIVTLAKHYPQLVGLNLARNYGQQNALLAGTRAAKFSVVVTLDDDLEQPPEAIPVLLKKLADGYDYVTGVSRKRSRSVFRNLASRIAFAVFTRASRSGVTPSPLRAFRTEVRGGFSDEVSALTGFDVLLNWSTNACASVEVDFSRSRRQISHYGFRQMLALFWGLWAGMSVWPLQLAAFFGATLLLVAAATGSILGWRLWLGETPSRFLLGCFILFTVCGLQSFLLGILGSYIGRIYFSSLRLPVNRVRERVG